MAEMPWIERTIASCLSESFAGEWGREPDPANALVLRATDIDDDGHIVGGGALRQIPQSKLRSKQLRAGDVLLEGSGGGPGKPVGRVALFLDGHELPSVCSNFFKTLRPNREVVDAHFLSRKLGWFYKQPVLLALQQQTTGIINLKFAGYLASELRLPESVGEQAKISEVLDTLDAAIRQTEAIIAKLKLVKQGLLHDLLTRGIDGSGELRPPQSQAPHLYKPSPLGWIPKEWQVETLGQMAVSSVIGPFGSSLVASDYRAAGVPVVFVRDIRPGRFEWKSNVFISPAKAATLAAHEVLPGDVVATKMGLPPCVAAVYVESMPAGVVTADIVRLRFDSRIHRPHWVSLTMNAIGTVKQVERITAGVTRPKVTLGDVRRLQIILPPAHEQDDLMNLVSSLDSRLSAEEKTLQKYRAQKSGLMDDLLTGRVRVTPLLEAAATP